MQRGESVNVDELLLRVHVEYVVQVLGSHVGPRESLLRRHQVLGVGESVGVVGFDVGSLHGIREVQLRVRQIRRFGYLVLVGFLHFHDGPLALLLLLLLLRQMQLLRRLLLWSLLGDVVVHVEGRLVLLSHGLQVFHPRGFVGGA